MPDSYHTKQMLCDTEGRLDDSMEMPSDSNDWARLMMGTLGISVSPNKTNMLGSLMSTSNCQIKIKCKAGITVENLRIYFGAYPESGDFPSGDPARYSRQNSIFILPTTMHSGMQKGFYTTGAENKKERYAVYLRDYDGDLSKMDGRRRMKEFKGSLLSTTLFQKDSIPDDRSLILNDGQVIPPPEQNTDMDGKKGKK